MLLQLWHKENTMHFAIRIIRGETFVLCKQNISEIIFFICDLGSNRYVKYVYLKKNIWSEKNIKRVLSLGLSIKDVCFFGFLDSPFCIVCVFPYKYVKICMDRLKLLTPPPPKNLNTAKNPDTISFNY